MNAKEIAKRLDLRHNVSIRVLDQRTHEVISEHEGHNASTNSLLTGIAHYLTGDGVLGQGDTLENWVPQYISLGTMGLINQEQDSKGYPAGIGNKEGPELERFVGYMKECPGFGADGYDANLNNNRLFLGLGPMYPDRTATGEEFLLQLGDIDQDGEVTQDDLVALMEYVSGIRQLDEKQQLVADVNQDNVIDVSDVQAVKEYLDGKRTLGKIKYIKTAAPTINCELISDSYPRAQITYREIVPESQAEYPKTIDVVFSAFVSTGALAQFRETDKDYVFITEAGLWSRPDWTSSGDNGLLAGYRITPPDEKNWEMAGYDAETGTYSDSPEYEHNRELLKQNIIKVGINQVVQVIWKIQIGGIEQLGGIERLYPTEHKCTWTIVNDDGTIEQGAGYDNITIWE